MFIPGVFATWNYSLFPITEEQLFISTGGLAEFYYKPEEILPGEEEDTQLHQNHYNLLQNIVNHIDYGLNATKKPIIRNLLLENHGVVYSEQNVQGGNLKHMMLNTSDVDRLGFVVQYVSDTEFAAYTFSSTQLTSKVGSYIEVYKTQIIYENGKWKDVRSFTGIAIVFRPQVVPLSIDVTTWQKT